jgi:D-beta-D-heptose 7-phosphate kinase/D-beta-D-heptose 1-phosphate adenosyltransferase
MSRKPNQTTRQLQRILQKFRKLRIGVLGDVMLDRYVWGDATRLSPETAVPVVNYVSQKDLPGGAGNVAVNLAALEAKVSLFGVVGGNSKKKGGKASPDDAGSALHHCLKNSGVYDRGVLTDASRITTLKTRIIARRHQIVRIDRERRDPLPGETEERLFRALLAALGDLDGLVLSDYDKGLLGDELTDRVLHAAHQAKVPVFVKPKSSRRRAYNGARSVVCNAKEAADYIGHTLPDDKSVVDAGRALLGHFGAAAMVITRGGQGMDLFQEALPHHLHIPATNFELTYARVGQSGNQSGETGREVYDVTGAGDTVLSILALAITAGVDLQAAATLANVAAGVVVGKLGTATVNTRELTAALQSHT